MGSPVVPLRSTPKMKNFTAGILLLLGGIWLGHPTV